MQNHVLAAIGSFTLVFGSLTACDDSNQDLGQPDAEAPDLQADAVTSFPDAGLADAGIDAGGVDAEAPEVGAPDALPDAQPDATVQLPDAAAPFACEGAQFVTGVLDSEVVALVDTETTNLRPRDLGLLCGNADPAVRWAPQEIVAYEVPGTGSIAVNFTTRSEATPENHDTVVQIRRECNSPPPFEDGRFPPITCFDDSGPSTSELALDTRSEGSFLAEGGETIYFVVTGYSGTMASDATDRGPVELRISATAAAQPPTLTDATPIVLGDDLRILLDGDDPDENVRGVIMNFRVGGAIFDIYGIGSQDPNVSALVFDREPGGLRNILRRPAVPLISLSAPPANGDGQYDILAATAGLNPPVGRFITNAGIEQIGMRIYDDTFEPSPEIVVDVITNAQRASYGEACDAAFCLSPLRCLNDICEASAGAETACGNVVDSKLSSPVGTYTSTSVTVRLPAGPSFFVEPGCVEPSTAEGSEVVMEVTVPLDGRFDLVATTDTQVTGATDTIMHLRETCINHTTEVTDACNDDMSQANRASSFEVLDAVPGTYFLVVERWSRSATTNPADIGVELALRPVVNQGDDCDLFGVESRCAVGRCRVFGLEARCAP